MNCNLSKIKLHLFHDKRLSEKENSEVAEHIQKCDSCRSEIEYLNELNSEFKRENAVCLPDELKTDLLKIEHRKWLLSDVFRDVWTIVINAKSLILHIPIQLENELRLKYSETITRWVFFC